MEAEKPHTEDPHILLLDFEKEIKQQETMLELIEPGYWRRKLTGSFFWVIEIFLYLIVLLFIASAFMFDINTLTHGSIEVTESTRFDAGFTNDDLNSINLVIRGILLAAALLTFIVALFLKSARKNLFKLADVHEYLLETLNKTKNKKDKLVLGLTKTNRENRT